MALDDFDFGFTSSGRRRIEDWWDWLDNLAIPLPGQGGATGATGATGPEGPPGKDASPLLSVLLSALQMTQAKKLANKQKPIDPMQLYQMLMRPGQNNRPQGFY